MNARRRTQFCFLELGCPCPAPMCPWASYLSSIKLSFLICTVEMINAWACQGSRGWYVEALSNKWCGSITTPKYEYLLEAMSFVKLWNIVGILQHNACYLWTPKIPVWLVKKMEDVRFFIQSNRAAVSNARRPRAALSGSLCVGGAALVPDPQLTGIQPSFGEHPCETCEDECTGSVTTLLWPAISQTEPRPGESWSAGAAPESRGQKTPHLWNLTPLQG